MAQLIETTWAAALPPTTTRSDSTALAASATASAAATASGNKVADLAQRVRSASASALIEAREWFELATSRTDAGERTARRGLRRRPL